MKEYINVDFLLNNETAKILYHRFCEGLPIIDYHCHISPKEIFEDKQYENITQAWLYGDHYKWRIMRTTGVDEKYVTGDGTDYEKFIAYAGALEKAIGNPIHSWSHMEMKRYFNCSEVLKASSAKKIWNETTTFLRENRLSPISIINSSKIEVICTTDDPVDSLEWHIKLREKTESGELKTKVIPAWRPDKVVNIDSPGFRIYIEKLEQVSEIKISNGHSLREALRNRMDFFGKNGCKVADHGIEYVPFVFSSERDFEEILSKALTGASISSYEAEKFKTNMLLFFLKEYSERNWVAQLHYSCERNVNSREFEINGFDKGYDTISNYAPSHKLCALFDRANREVLLPKTIVYSLNPSDNATIDSIIGAFQDGKTAGKIQHGSAWWFNDHKKGMEEMMTSLANRGVLGEFIGMLTDSRSFLSYERHDYFRRVLANLIGKWVEEGIYPVDYESLEKILKGISYENAKRYFEF